MNADQSHVPIVPRERLDFGLDGDIPRYWMDNDPFKTRFFDAMFRELFNHPIFCGGGSSTLRRHAIVVFAREQATRQRTENNRADPALAEN